MGLLKTAEEKDQIRQKKVDKALREYGMQNITNPEDIASVQKIVSELVGSGFVEYNTLDYKINEVAMQMNYQRAIIEQNFIIIRQLDRLCSAFYDR